MINFGNFINILPLGFIFADCEVQTALIGTIGLIVISIINKLPVGKDK